MELLTRRKPAVAVAIFIVLAFVGLLILLFVTSVTEVNDLVTGKEEEISLSTQETANSLDRANSTIEKGSEIAASSEVKAHPNSNERKSSPSEGKPPKHFVHSTKHITLHANDFVSSRVVGKPELSTDTASLSLLPNNNTNSQTLNPNTTSQSNQANTPQIENENSSHIEIDNFLPYNLEKYTKSASNECLIKFNHLVYLLESCTDQNGIAKSFEEAKIMCGISETLLEFTTMLFESRKVWSLGADLTKSKDLNAFFGLRSNLSLLGDYRNWDPSLCQKYSELYNQAYNALLQNPMSLENARKAYAYFAPTKEFCKSLNFSSPTFVCFLRKRIFESLESMSLNSFKFIEMLRLLRPKALFSFPECVSVEDVQKRYQKFKVINESVLCKRYLGIREGLSINVNQIDDLLEKAKIRLTDPHLDEAARRYLESNIDYFVNITDYSRLGSSELLFIFRILISKLIRGAKDGADLLSIVDEAQEWLAEKNVALFPSNQFHIYNQTFRMDLPAEEIVEWFKKIAMPCPIPYDQSTALSAEPPRPVMNRGGICHAISFYQCLASVYPLIKQHCKKPEDPKARKLLALLEGITTKDNFDLQSFLNLPDYKPCTFALDDLMDLFSSWELDVLNLFHLMASSYISHTDNTSLFPFAYFSDFMDQESGWKFNPNGPLFIIVYDDPVKERKIFMEIQFENFFEPGRMRKYELFGVCTSPSGHYTAYVKRGNNRWYQCDDAVAVSLLDSSIKDLAKNISPDLLFYLLQ